MERRMATVSKQQQRQVKARRYAIWMLAMLGLQFCLQFKSPSKLLNLQRKVAPCMQVFSAKEAKAVQRNAQAVQSTSGGKAAGKGKQENVSPNKAQMVRQVGIQKQLEEVEIGNGQD
eukprot:416274-Karenia_brevis.AAC.1